MRIRAQLQLPQLSLQRYMTDMKARLGEQIARAAAEWLSTVTDVVPVWSGASRGTFLKLAHDISFAIDIAPTVASRVPLGQGHSEGRVDIDPQAGRYSFSYQTDLPHLLVNEATDATRFGFHLRQPGPYHFQEKGAKAVDSVLADTILPNPFDSVRITTLSI